MSREHASRLAPVFAGLIIGLGCRATVRGPSPVPTEPPKHGPITNNDELDPTARTSTSDDVEEAAKQSFVKETCALLCAQTYKDCRCEVTHEMEDWILFRLADGVADGMRWRWFVGASTTGGYKLIMGGSYYLHLPPDSEEEPIIESHYLCMDFTPGADPPTNGGVDIKTVDATGDGRLDLVIECKHEEWGESIRQTCADGEEYCNADVFCRAPCRR